MSKLIAILIGILLSWLTCISNCSETLKKSDEVISKESINNHTFVAVRECPLSAIGRCFVRIYEIKGSHFWTKHKDQMLQCSSFAYEANFSLVDSNLLLLGFRAGDWGVNEPQVFVPLNYDGSNFILEDRFVSFYWPQLSFDTNATYSTELYKSEDQGDIFCLHIWLNHDNVSHRNIYFLGAQEVKIEFIKERVIKVQIDWLNRIQHTEFYFLLWDNPRGQVEFLTKSIADSLLKQPVQNF